MIKHKNAFHETIPELLEFFRKSFRFFCLYQGECQLLLCPVMESRPWRCPTIKVQAQWWIDVLCCSLSSQSNAHRSQYVNNKRFFFIYSMLTFRLFARLNPRIRSFSFVPSSWSNRGAFHTKERFFPMGHLTVYAETWRVFALVPSSCSDLTIIFVILFLSFFALPFFSSKRIMTT